MFFCTGTTSDNQLRGEGILQTMRMHALVAMLLLLGSLDFVLSMPTLSQKALKRAINRLDGRSSRHQSQQPRLQRRQITDISDLVLPTCALTCYLDTITTDGCANEVDFQCHCSTGNLMGKSENCVRTACSQEDQEIAKSKITSACKAIGVNVPGGGQNTGSSPSRTQAQTTVTVPPIAEPTTTPGSDPDSNESTATPASSPDSNDSTATAPASAATNSIIRSTSVISRTTSSRSSPTNSITKPTSVLSEPTASASTTTSPFPAGPYRGLSKGAKVGISAAFTVIAAIVFTGLLLYIRGLKRQLTVATTASGNPISTHAAQNTISSFGGTWPTVSRGPVSPLTPVFARDPSQRSGASIRKKRHTLSVVLEREDEDGNNGMRRRSVAQPGAGQGDALRSPAELHGGLTSPVELPASFTPKVRQMEWRKPEWRRTEWEKEKGFDFGV